MTATSGRHSSSSSGSLSNRALRKVAGPRYWGPSTWASRLGVVGIRLQFSQRHHFRLSKTDWGGRNMKRVPIVLVTAAMTLAACGGSTAGPAASSGGPSKVASIAAEVPSSVPTPIQIATDATYSPDEYIDPNTGDIVGWDIDMGKAICKVMGVACTFNNVTFDDIIAQLKASTPSEMAGGDTPRYVFSISSWSPTAKREQSGIDFITYYKAGEAWIEKASGGPTINSAADMCGHSVAVESGTTEESDAWGYMGQNVGGTAISGDTDNCKKAGKDDIKV